MTSLLFPIVTFTSLILFAFIAIIRPTQYVDLLPRAREFYESLRAAPRLSPDATLSDRCRHACHRAYFRYLITGPGYMLEPAERIVFDCFVVVLLGATAWCVPLFYSLAVGLVQANWLIGMKRRIVRLVRLVRDEMLRWAETPTTGVEKVEGGLFMLLRAHAYWG